MKKNNLTFIINFLHPVYNGYLSIFSKYYNLSLYSTFGGYMDKEIFHKQYKFKFFKEFKKFKVFFSCLYWFNKDEIKINKSDFTIVGDTFTNSLSYSLRGKNVIYYGEYIPYKGKIIKNLLFYILGFLFFYNKKIIVPTLLSYNAYKKFSKNLYYFPQLYCNDISENNLTNNNSVKILIAVYDLSSKAKNIKFAIDNFLELSNTNKNLTLTLVGKILDHTFLDEYKEQIEEGKIIYYDFMDAEELKNIYQTSDIFVLPSLRDPIGSVVLEAMSQGCAVLVSDQVGASSYVENGKNGFVFKINNNEDFKSKLLEISKNTLKYKEQSIEILQKKYSIHNKDLTDKIFLELNNFLIK